MAKSALRDISPTWWKDIKPQALQEQGSILSQFTSLDTPENMSLGATVADLLMGFAPGIGTAQGIRDFERARRDDDTLGMVLGGVGAIPIAGGITKTGKAVARAAKKSADALDMSQAARMQRAQEMGFSPDIVYHGTGKEFDAFDPGMSSGARSNTGIFLSQSPDVASTYALGQERQVLPLMYRTEAPIQIFAEKANWNRLGPNTRVELPARTVNRSEDADILRALGIEVESSQEMLPRSTTLGELFPEVYGYEDDFIDTNDFSRWAKRQGADAVIFNDIIDHGPSGMFSNEKARNPARNISIFDPANIRSVNAAFDPAKRGSANLMAGAAGGAIGLSALRNIQRDEEK
jgi:hypothetical protein